MRPGTLRQVDFMVLASRSLAILTALGAPPKPSISVEDQAIERLGGGPFLLLFDNVEHVVSATPFSVHGPRPRKTPGFCATVSQR